MFVAVLATRQRAQVKQALQVNICKPHTSDKRHQSIIKNVAVCCIVRQCAAVCATSRYQKKLQWVAECCIALQCAAVCATSQYLKVTVSQCVAVWYSVLQWQHCSINITNAIIEQLFDHKDKVYVTNSVITRTLSFHELYHATNSINAIIEQLL